jgi:hypothetical protein
MIELFQKTISTGNQNTYKFALGLAMVQEYKDDSKINLLPIAKRFAEYYYRNHIVFKLRETNNPDQEPMALIILRRLVREYYKDDLPPRKIDNIFKEKYSNALLNPPLDLRKSVFTYVLPCWQGAKKSQHGNYLYPSNGKNDFFSYSKDEGFLVLTQKFEDTIKRYRRTLLSITILEWARFIEKFNQLPNLISKISPTKPTRRLLKFKKIFDSTALMKANVCHLCGLPINHQDWTQDHMIPFEYIYSDELWNLTPAHRFCNSKKGARVGSNEMINRLIERNRKLWHLEGTLAQRWMKASATSIQELENKVLSSADSAMKAGFRQVENSIFHIYNP